ncbi:metallophosphoesterase [Flavobacterium frigidarium]|uniref:metallophosphoesterase n=1 Tax=Flavobacterium frigidarium TaxID=99286 RepID=UPI0030D7FE40|tara:strand:- start:3570 stop:4802 length:1233 start_codon:yes stop_codon:yes gene_type:complete
MVFRIFLLSLFLFIVELYAFQAIKTLIKLKWFLVAYQVVSAIALLYIVYSFTQFDRSIGQTRQTMITMALFLIIYTPKLILTLFMLGEDIFRVGSGSTRFFMQSENFEFLNSRRKFVSQIGLGLAAIPFASLIYGVTVGKYNYKVIKQRIYFPDLPEAFDGFKITQISDVHSGSFDNAEKINYAIDLVNEQDSDMILFTGDIVNTHATEMHPWIDTFKRIKKHAYGKYAVLGNHDYGEYVTWPNAKEKEANFQAIKGLYGQIDFDLLLNEHTYIEKGPDRFALIGVENWGHNFKKAGDIAKASEGVAQSDFKVLMSHDPSHWDYEIKNHDKNFHLTLAGHTHGMQFGIEIPGYFKWSLAQYVYAQWAGLYENLGRYVYVNRGFGFHAYPGRVGIMPEITVIELKKGERVA